MILEKMRLPVEEYTSVNPITATVDTSFLELLKLMKTNGVRHIPILENGKLAGIVSQRDLKVVYAVSRKESFTAKDLMVEDPFVVPNDMCLDEVAMQMSERKIGSAIVEDSEGEIYGIFTSTDALNALIEVLRQQVS